MPLQLVHCTWLVNYLHLHLHLHGNSVGTPIHLAISASHTTIGKPGQHTIVSAIHVVHLHLDLFALVATERNPPYLAEHRLPLPPGQAEHSQRSTCTPAAAHGKA